MFLVQITKATRADDVHRTFENNLDAAICAANADDADGYRIIQYEPGGATTLRANSRAMLRIHGEVADTEVVYDTLAEARTTINGISASEGYELIDLEQPLGSAPSIVVESRPALWQRVATPIAQRENEHGRGGEAEQDRF